MIWGGKLVGGSGCSLPALNDLCKRSSMSKSTCSVESCDRPFYCKGYCSAHYARLKRTGSLQVDRPIGPLRGDSHYLWSDVPSYAAVHHRLQNQRGSATQHPCAECGNPAKQWAYDRSGSGERIDESTGFSYSTELNRYEPLCLSCHKYRDLGHSPLVCKYGHLLSVDNLYISPKTGTRQCRECKRRYHREYIARKKEACLA